MIRALPGIYHENPDALKELCASDEMRVAVKDRADAAAEFARAEQARHNDDGEHAAAIYSGEPYLDDTSDPPVWRCDVGSTSSTWHLMEFGSIHNPPFRPLTTGVEAIGLDYQPGPG